AAIPYVLTLTVSTSFLVYPNSRPPATYTLSLHDALPISLGAGEGNLVRVRFPPRASQLHKSRGKICHAGPTPSPSARRWGRSRRSEEHTSELQSPYDLVCRLLLEKKKISDNGVTYLQIML